MSFKVNRASTTTYHEHITDRLPIIGSIDNFPSVLAALQGAYGVYVNTDSFTIGQVKEVFVGMRIFELAKQAGTIKHYVWSSLDNVFKASLMICSLVCLPGAHELRADRRVRPEVLRGALYRQGSGGRLAARPRLRCERRRHVLEYPDHGPLHGHAQHGESSLCPSTTSAFTC